MFDLIDFDFCLSDDALWAKIHLIYFGICTFYIEEKVIKLYSGSNKYLPRPGSPTVGNSIAWLNPPPRGGGAGMGASAAPPDSWRVWTARAPSLGPSLGLVDLPTGR